MSLIFCSLAGFMAPDNGSCICFKIPGERDRLCPFLTLRLPFFFSYLANCLKSMNLCRSRILGSCLTLTNLPLFLNFIKPLSLPFFLYFPNKDAREAFLPSWVFFGGFSSAVSSIIVAPSTCWMLVSLLPFLYLFAAMVSRLCVTDVGRTFAELCIMLLAAAVEVSAVG